MQQWETSSLMHKNYEVLFNMHVLSYAKYQLNSVSGTRMNAKDSKQQQKQQQHTWYAKDSVTARITPSQSSSAAARALESVTLKPSQKVMTTTCSMEATKTYNQGQRYLGVRWQAEIYDRQYSRSCCMLIDPCHKKEVAVFFFVRGRALPGCLCW